MKNNSILVIVAVFVIVFIVVFGIFQLFSNRKSYSCFDYENNVTYKFKTEEEMHEVCDRLNGVADDNVMSSYSIYEDLVNTDDTNGFSFDPYVIDDELVIIVAITDCSHPEQVKERVKQWFSNRSYNINDYKIEYENPCEG